MKYGYRIPLLVGLCFMSCSKRQQTPMDTSEALVEETRSPSLEESPALVEEAIEDPADSSSRDPSLETFDVSAFEAIKSSDNQHVVTLDDGTRILRFGDSDSGYYRYTLKPGALFEERLAFYKEGTLKVKGLAFISGGFGKGVFTHYDKAGQIERRVDYDLPFDFPWEKVERFCQGKKIDLRSNLTSVQRSVVDGKAKWVVQWKLPKARFARWTIDGKTGEILQKQTMRARK